MKSLAFVKLQRKRSQWCGVGSERESIGVGAGSDRILGRCCRVLRGEGVMIARAFAFLDMEWREDAAVVKAWSAAW